MAFLGGFVEVHWPIVYVNAKLEQLLAAVYTLTSVAVHVYIPTLVHKPATCDTVEGLPVQFVEPEG